MRSPAVLGIVVLSTSLLVSVPAGAVTLSKAGIAPEVLVALVEVNDRLYSLTVERLLEMKRSGWPTAFSSHWFAAAAYHARGEPQLSRRFPRCRRRRH